MKRNFYILAGLILAGFFLAGFYTGKHHMKGKIRAAFPSSMPPSAAVNPTNVYKDSSGITHFEYNTIVNTITKKEALRQSSPLLPYIDSLALALTIKPKQIESSTIITTATAADSTAFLKKQIDSLKRMVLNYKDKYLSLTVRTGNASDTLDKGSFDFAYNADLKINQYYKRKKILGLPIGPKQSFADISSNDPRTTIKGLSKFTVQQSLPGYGVRLQALSSYNFFTHSINSGFGLRYDFGRWSILGAYYYNFTIKEWQPVANVRYDILKF